MPALNGYGTLTEGDSSTSAVDTAAETFITNGLSKVLKINNICDNEHLADCGIPSKITTMGAIRLDTPTKMSELNEILTGSYSVPADNMSLLDTKAAAFETANGESVIAYYNPVCVGNLNDDAANLSGIYIAKKVCVNFVYDLNGNKGPNTVGKDIGFLTALYPSDVKVVAPVPAVNPLPDSYAIKPSGSDISASKACTMYDSEYRLPNVDEMASMIVNNNLIKGNDSNSVQSGFFWTSSPIPAKVDSRWNHWRTWYYGFDDADPTEAFRVWCIKR